MSDNLKSADLRAEFGQKSGFSAWTKNTPILGRCADPLQREFYLVALNEQVKLSDENDAIGIIICKSKKKTVVEYALKTATQLIDVATYSLIQHLPAVYQHLLPNEDEIRARLQGWLGLGAT